MALNWAIFLFFCLSLRGLLIQISAVREYESTKLTVITYHGNALWQV